MHKELKQYIENNVNIDSLIVTLSDKMQELKHNMIDYQGEIHVCTLVSCSGHTEEDFLKLIGIPEDDIFKAVDGCFVNDMAEEYMYYLHDDLQELIDDSNFLLGEFNINVGYMDNFEGINLMLQYGRWWEIDHLDEDEYKFRVEVAEHFGCSVADVIDLDDDRYQVDGREYIIVNDDKATEIAGQYIEDTLFAFRPSFIAQETSLPEEMFEALAQNDKCEGNNDALSKVIEATCGMEKFIDSAISSDGRGNYINSYDGEEIEIDINGDTYYAYRLN